MKNLNRFLVRLLIVFVVLTSISVSIGAGIIYSFYRQLPYVSLESYEQSVNSKIFDENGKLILELFKDENRTKKVGLNEISPYVIQALISIEDKRFYQHYGIDIKRIIKSFIVDIKHGSLVQGGSTITQLLARNAFLTFDKKISRKIKEILLAFKLERQFTKDEILVLFLNEVSFGEGTYGIESAANVYFRKHAKELDIAESAMLAGIINATTAYNPLRNYDRSINRRNIVLREMYKDGKISEDEYNKALNSEPDLKGKKNTTSIAPYFIYSTLLPRLGEKYGQHTVNTGGLKIYTTINSEIQKIAEEEFEKYEIFQEYPDLNGGMLVIEAKTGKTLAVVGGKGFSQSDQFNRAYNAVRQPGSLMKPIVYLTAFDNGIPPNRIFSDVPREYFDPWTQTIWQPQNYEGRYHGPVILRVALANSYNIVAIELLKEVGPKNVIANAKLLGIDSNLRGTLSLALGSYSVTPLELAQVYSVFSNNGVKVSIYDTTKVEDQNGIELEKNNYNAKKVFSEETVSILNNVLEEVVNLGSGTRAKIRGYNIAGKTGTTDDFTNAWFCGFTPNLVVISYLGYDMPQTIGEHASGGRITAPLVKNVMERILKKFPERFPPEPFKPGENVIKMKICRESGLIASDDCQFTIDTYFHKGTEPKMICNFHDPDVDTFDDMADTEEFDMFFKKDSNVNTMFNRDKKTFQKKVEQESDLDRLKNELNFFD